jgi:hypothetical protein
MLHTSCSSVIHSLTFFSRLMLENLSAVRVRTWHQIWLLAWVDRDDGTGYVSVSKLLIDGSQHLCADASQRL